MRGVEKTFFRSVHFFSYARTYVWYVKRNDETSKEKNHIRRD